MASNSETAGVLILLLRGLAKGAGDDVLRVSFNSRRQRESVFSSIPSMVFIATYPVHLSSVCQSYQR